LGTLKLALVALAMVLGGWLHSTRVAQTMSLRITELNAGQGLTANLVTSGLVLDASQLGLPVSTTHVSCGAIFGIGLASGQGYWATIRRILVTWGTTLPLALLLGLVFGYLLQSLDF
jgi:PiT family inorganic phosphate transporter